MAEIKDDPDQYFLSQGRAELAELKRHPDIDMDLLLPWGGNFKIDEEK